MTVEDDETELLFLLEVIVDSVTLEDKVMTVADVPLRVGFNFIDFPMVDIQQEAFSDALKTPKGGVFSSGKSILFPMGPRQLLASIEESPLTLTVFRQLPGMVSPDILGHTRIRLSDGMGEIVRGIIESRGAVPAARFLRSAFPLMGLKGERSGEISIFVRLSCLGQTVLSKVQILDDQEAYLFKNVTLDDTLTAAGLPEYLKSPRVASPKESYLDVQSGASPLMYSLEEAHYTRSDETAIDGFRSMAGDRVRQTMNHILYELDQIGDFGLPSFRVMPCHTDSKVPSNVTVPGDMSLLYKLSEMQKIMDMKMCYETSEDDLQVIQEGVQSGQPLFYCTPKNEFENVEKELQVRAGLSSGAGQTQIFRKSMLSLTQHRRISTSARNNDTPCTCKESSNWWQTPQNHFDKSTGASDKQSVTPSPLKYPKSSCACDDRRKWHAQTSNASNTHVLKDNFPTPAQQKQTHHSTIKYIDANTFNYSGKVRACPESPNLLCACNHVEGTHLPQSEVVCFPLGPRLPAHGVSLRADDLFPKAEKDTATVVWRIPDDLGCTCTHHRFPEPSQLYADSPPSVRDRIGLQEGCVLPALDASFSYTPVNPPVRYDTTGRLSPAGRGEMPVETRAHPPVRYYTTSILSPAYNHPPVRYDTTGALSPAAAAAVAPSLDTVALDSDADTDTSFSSSEEDTHNEELVEGAVDAPCTCCCCCCCRCLQCTCRVRVTTVLEKAVRIRRKVQNHYRPWRPGPSQPRRRRDIPTYTTIPPHMGWLWTESSLAVHEGWRPGYIPRSVLRAIKEHRQRGKPQPPGQELQPPRLGRKVPWGSRQPCPRGQAPPLSTTKLHPEKHGTLHVVQREGKFYVSVASRDPGQEPLRFRVPGYEEGCSPDSEHSWPLSNRSSDINLNLISPADLAPPPRQVKTRCVGVQFDERDLPPAPQPPMPILEPTEPSPELEPAPIIKPTNSKRAKRTKK